jgi:glycosyltransferase involved in cell wall biosynthesis
MEVAMIKQGPIYVEVSPLLTKHLTGIGRFAARLVEALARYRPLRLVNTIQGEHARNMGLSNALPCGTEIEVNGVGLPRADADVRGWARQLFHGRRRPHDRNLARECAILYTMLRPGERHFRRELCLLHDFTPMIMPGLHVAETRAHFGVFFTRHAALCDKLIANSRSTKADAGWLCARPADDVLVSYPGPSMCVREHAHPKPVARRKNFILVVSTLEPRKNGPFLFNWFLQTQALSPETELWWVGPRGWLLDQAPERARRSERGRHIHFLGVVSDRRLCELYRQATFTVYPSLYEGFGFPVLDSLRHGTSVVCSYNSSLQEFAGPGVFYFDACDDQSLDRACREALFAGEQANERNDLEERFSWDLMARQVIALCA